MTTAPLGVQFLAPRSDTRTCHLLDIFECRGAFLDGIQNDPTAYVCAVADRFVEVGHLYVFLPANGPGDHLTAFWSGASSWLNIYCFCCL